VRKLLLGGVFTMLFFTVFFAFVVMGYIMRVLCEALEGRDGKLPDWKDLGRLFNEGMMPMLVALGWASPIIALFVAAQVLTATLGLNLWILFIYLLLEAVLSVAFSMILPLALIRLAIKRSLKAAFDIGQMLEFIRRNKGMFFTAWGLTFAVGAVASVGFAAFVIGFFFTTFIANVISMHLFAQAYRASQPFSDDKDGAVRASMAIPPPLKARDSST
jgi:MFS family permease